MNLILCCSRRTFPSVFWAQPYMIPGIPFRYQLFAIYQEKNTTSFRILMRGFKPLICLSLAATRDYSRHASLEPGIFDKFGEPAAAFSLEGLVMIPAAFHI